jgi:hypothetical protein
MDPNTQMQMRACSPKHFAWFRIVLGVYLCIHFAYLIPYSTEMFSSDGLLKDHRLNLTNGIFPNLLKVWDSPQQLQIFLSVLTLLSLLLALGIFRPVVSLLIWYGWVCLFDRNNLISNPGLPFIGWLLLVCAAVPRGEPFCLFQQRKDSWQFPIVLFWGAWIIMAHSYTLSGVDKLLAPSWQNGEAIIFLLDNPLARNWWLREFFLSFPHWLLYVMTWSILVMEIIFLPLAIFNKTRKYAWFGMVIMHFGILLIVDFADLTCGMLMIHVLTFDPLWIVKTKSLDIRR